MEMMLTRMPVFQWNKASDDHEHVWGPCLADTPGNLFGAVLHQTCATCGKRRRCREA